MSSRLSTWILLPAALLACHPRAPSEEPGSRPERAERRSAAGPAVELAVARDRTCAVMAGGELRCWGDNERGQLGDGTLRTRRYPHAVLGIDDAEQVAVGSQHSCARHRDGRVSCWGRGREGQLGDGSREDRRTPVEVAGLRDAIDVGVGADHSCAVRSDGSTWCWGNGHPGALGDGTSTTRSEPVLVKALGPARRVRLGEGYSCAWLRDDSVWCWGSQGRYSQGSDPEPRVIAALPPVIDLAVGSGHACAVTREGEVRCWGQTFMCEHGVSQLEPVTVPAAVRGLPPMAALAGPQCGRAREGELLCWDRDRAPHPVDDRVDDYDRTIACTTERVLPELTRRATQIAAHPRGGCAVLEDETAWCWGEGRSGQLGDGGEVSRPEGVEVVALREPVAAAGPTPLQVMTRALVDAGIPQTGLALLWHDAAIYASAGASDSVGQLEDFPEALRGDPHDGVLPVRILAVHGERLEVEPLGPAASHCGARSWVGFDRYELRMFVRALDLVPVVARELAMGYPDGSAVTLGAGVVLRPVEAGVVARVGSLTLRLELRKGEAGLAYAAPGLALPAGRGPSWELPQLAPHAHLTLDDRRVYVEELPERLQAVQRIQPDEALGVSRVHVEDACVALDMVADAPVPTIERRGVGGVLGGGSSKRVTFTRVREGAPAYWKGGAPAGRVRTSYRTVQALRADGKRRCLSVAGGLSLCHDAADLSEETDEVSPGAKE